MIERKEREPERGDRWRGAESFRKDVNDSDGEKCEKGEKIRNITECKAMEGKGN